jgi:hypothetical protein
LQLADRSDDVLYMYVYEFERAGDRILDDIHLARAEDIIWEWRLGFSSHWGKHAIDALRTIHFRLGAY